MKPYIHALSSAKKFGGKPENYLEIHDTMDNSKCAEASVKHRAIFHSAYGIFIIEKIFGVNITNSDGKLVSVRDIAEQHVLEDLGTIPTLNQWLQEMTIRPWMGKPLSKRKQREIVGDKVDLGLGVEEEIVDPQEKESVLAPEENQKLQEILDKLKEIKQLPGQPIINPIDTTPIPPLPLYPTFPRKIDILD